MKCFIVFFLLLAGCSNHYLSLEKMRIDRSYLASTFVESPDPLQLNPPYGERVLIAYCIPRDAMPQHPKIVLTLLFNSFEQKRVEIPLKSSLGNDSYSLLGEEFIQTGGILTYKAEVVTEEGESLLHWKHQLWTELITIDERRS